MISYKKNPTVFIINVLLCLSGLIAAVPQTASAQAIRYMDESGNLHFVDSLYQVPPRYRNQVVEPTPAPDMKKFHLLRPTPKPRSTPTPRPKKTPRTKNLPKNASLSPLTGTAPGELPKQNESVASAIGRTLRAPSPVLGGINAQRPPSGVSAEVVAPAMRMRDSRDTPAPLFFVPTPIKSPTEIPIIVATATTALPPLIPTFTATVSPSRTSTPVAIATDTFEETLFLEPKN